MQARRPGCGARARGAPPCSPRARWHTPDRQQRRVRRVERQAAAAGRRQVDAVLARLGMLKERIDATEACIALDLDHRRNELVAYNLVRVRSVHGSAHPAEQRGLASAQSLQGACMRRVPRGGRCALRRLARTHPAIPIPTLYQPYTFRYTRMQTGAGAARRR